MSADTASLNELDIEGEGEEWNEEERRLARLLIGGRMHRRRLRRLLLVYLLRERMDEGGEGEEEEGDEGEAGSGDERRVLIGGRMLGLRRMRRLMLSHLLRMEGGEEDEEGEDQEEGEDEAEGEEGGDEDHRLFRLLVATGILRRRRLRRLLLAHLRRERMEEGGEDERQGQEGSDEERRTAEPPASRREHAAQSERAEAVHAGGKPRPEKRRRATRR